MRWITNYITWTITSYVIHTKQWRATFTKLFNQQVKLQIIRYVVVILICISDHSHQYKYTYWIHCWHNRTIQLFIISLICMGNNLLWLKPISIHSQNQSNISFDCARFVMTFVITMVVYRCKHSPNGRVALFPRMDGLRSILIAYEVCNTYNIKHYFEYYYSSCFFSKKTTMIWFMLFSHITLM